MTEVSGLNLVSGMSQPELWLSPPDHNRAIDAQEPPSSLYATAMWLALQVRALEEREKRAREGLRVAFGGDKPDKPATPTERARFWLVEAAHQKSRADKLEAELTALRAEWESIPTGALFDYWLGGEPVHPDANDAAPEVEVWIRHLYDLVNGEGASEQWLK